MSDQGDAGQWRPATSQSDQFSAPDDATGPLPAVREDEADEQHFPSVRPAEGSSSGGRTSWSEWSDDDAPTGGFPAVSDPQEPAGAAGPPAPPAPAAPVTRSPFEPADRSGSSEPPASSPEESPAPPPPAQPEVPGPTDATPRFGTDVAAPDPEPERPFRSFDESSLGESSFAESSFGTKPYETHETHATYEAYEPKSYEQPEPSYGAQDTAPPPDSNGSYGMPAPPERHVTAEDEAAENEFFASDDHPPMWDKVVAPSGPPPKPGKPSSGNLRLPDWMRDEQNAAAAGGTPQGPPGGPSDDDEGRSKRPLIIGLSVLAVGLLAAAGAYLLKHDGDNPASNASAPSRSTTAPTQTPAPPANTTKPVPNKPLPQFKGMHTKAVGRLNDSRSGLSYARLAKPWAVPPRRSPMTEFGFSANQFAVTEKAGGEPKRWARLMSAQLTGAARTSYQGPETARETVTDLAQVYEARMFNFRHRQRHLASQPLTIAGHKGWLVSDYVTYHRRGMKATGDVVMVALVDTGKKSPGVLFMSVPNTHRKLWPDVDFVVRSLRVT